VELAPVPEDVFQLTKPENADTLNLFFDFLKEYRPAEVARLGQDMAQIARRKQGSKIQDNEARLQVLYTSAFLEVLKQLQQVIANACNSMGVEAGVSQLREAMVDMSVDRTTAEFQLSSQGLPAWFEGARAMAGSREWKMAIAESVKQLGIIEKAMRRDGKVPDGGVTQAIEAVGTPFRAFAVKEGELRKSVEALIGLTEKPDAKNEDLAAHSKAVFRAGQEAALATEDFAKAVEKAAGEVRRFMKERAQQVYKENLATVANEVSSGILAIKEVTFLACTAIGAAGSGFWPLAVVAAVLAAVSAKTVSYAINEQAFKATEDRNTVEMLLSTQFGQQKPESVEKAERYFEKVEKGMDQTDRLNVGIDSLDKLTEAGGVLHDTVSGLQGSVPVPPAIQAVAAGVKGVAGAVLPPISATIGGVSLMFAFAQGDPKGMHGKWDNDTTEAFKTAVDECYELSGKRLMPDPSSDYQIDEYDQAKKAFKVTMFGMEGYLFPNGRFEPTGHQYALQEAVRLAKKAKKDVQVLRVPDGPDGRAYGPANVVVGLDHIDGTPTWNVNEMSLTFTAPVFIKLQGYPTFKGWDERWTVKAYASDGDVEFPGDASSHFSQMPYMRLVTFYEGRDILHEDRSERHPFNLMVGDRDGSGRLMVLDDVRSEERPDVERWLEESGVRRKFKEAHDGPYAT
jgi:hypothetical protein